MAAALAVGLLVENLRDHAHGQMILSDVDTRPQPAVTSDMDSREQALLERLRAGPKAMAALEPVGRILTLPDNKSCLLTAREPAKRPFPYPFEQAPVTGDAPGGR